MKMKMLTFTSLALVAFLAAVSPARAQQTKDIVDTAVAAGSFKTLAKALAAADLVGTLKGPGPFTVFARPTRRSRNCPPARWTICSSRRTRRCSSACSRITSCREG
jgi:hypothetical protein